MTDSGLDNEPTVVRTDGGELSFFRTYETNDGFEIVVINHRLYTDDKEGAAIARLYAPDDPTHSEPLAYYRERENADLEHMVEALAESRHVLHDVRGDHK